MKIYYYDLDYRIAFHVRARIENVLDELAFICLLEMKFNGTITSAHKFWGVVGEKKRRFFSVILSLEDFTALDGAKYHCRRNVNTDGTIRADYLGALDAADPRRQAAEKLRARAEGAMRESW